MNDYYDLIISNGLIIDGTGQPGFKGTIGIRDGRIVSVGESAENASTAGAIPAKNLVVSPGFIDAHSHDDFFPLISPACEEKVAQGVTTTVVGNCGFSPAPMADNFADELKDSIRVISDLDIDINRLKSFESYLEVIESTRPGINIVPLLGHGTLRISAMGLSKRPPSASEMKSMLDRTAEAMEAGAFGMSTGLSYVPGEYATLNEIVELAEVVHRYGGIYTSHIRSERDGVLEAVNEALSVGESASIPVQISHLKVAGANNWGKSEAVIKIIEDAAASGVAVTCDVYPYNASNTFLTSLLPPHLFSDGYAAFAKKIGDGAFRKEIVHAIETEDDISWENKIKGTGFDSIVITGSTQFQHFNGRSVLDIAESEEKDPYDVIFDIMAVEGNRVGIVLFAMDEADIQRFLKAPFAMVGSDGGPKPGQAFFHPRFTGTFPRVLGKYVREERALGLEEAVHKMTDLPAKTFGLKNKGRIQTGWDADLVIFDLQQIIDRSTFAQPSLKPQGIEWVIVNGKVAVDNGKITGRLGGRVLRNR